MSRVRAAYKTESSSSTATSFFLDVVQVIGTNTSDLRDYFFRLSLRFMAEFGGDGSLPSAASIQRGFDYLSTFFDQVATVHHSNMDKVVKYCVSQFSKQTQKALDLLDSTSPMHAGKVERYDPNNLLMQCAFIVLFVRNFPAAVDKGRLMVSHHDLFRRYPEFAVEDIAQQELTDLVRYTNWLNVVLLFVKAQAHKKQVISLSLVISEGRVCSFGGGVGRVTERRIFVYRREGDVPLDYSKAERTKGRVTGQAGAGARARETIATVDDDAAISMASGSVKLGQKSDLKSRRKVVLPKNSFGSCQLLPSHGASFTDQLTMDVHSRSQCGTYSMEMQVDDLLKPPPPVPIDWIVDGYNFLPDVASLCVDMEVIPVPGEKRQRDFPQSLVETSYDHDHHSKRAFSKEEFMSLDLDCHPWADLQDDFYMLDELDLFQKIE